MTTLSDPTLGILIDAIGQHDFTPAELGVMLLRCDLARYGDGSRRGDTTELLVSALLGAQEQAAAAGDHQAHHGLLKFVRVFIEKTIRMPAFAPRWLTELREGLLADGYQMRWASGCLPNEAGRFDLVPTDAGPVPLAPEINALEQDLGARGYTVTLNHYKQAVNAYRQHDFEAANGQLRAALEDLVVQLAIKHAGFAKPIGQGGGGPAIEHLKATVGLAPDDGGDLLRGLWKMSHTNGSHPGRSDADEARFRLHTVTAIARLLLHRFR
jgi:hypothetical protein